MHSDLRAWNWLCELAVSPAACRLDDEAPAPAPTVAPLEDWTPVLISDLSPPRDVDGGSSSEKVAETTVSEKASEERATRTCTSSVPGEVEGLIDEAFDAAARAGALTPWVGSATVDLHGYSVLLARAAMRHVLSELQVEYAAAPRGWGELHADRFADGLVVVVGRGRGSGVGGPQLGGEILTLLGEAKPPLAARLVARNDGRVLVDRPSLLAWLRANAAEG